MYLEKFSYFDTLHNKDLTFDCLSLFWHSLVPRLIATCKITFLTINFSQFFFHQKACAVSCFLHHFPPYPLHRRAHVLEGRIAYKGRPVNWSAQSDRLHQPTTNGLDNQQLWQTRSLQSITLLEPVWNCGNEVEDSFLLLSFKDIYLSLICL